MAEKHFSMYGCALIDTLKELMAFEENFRPELKKIVAEYDDLTAKAARMGAELDQERAELDKVKADIFADMAKRREKIRDVADDGSGLIDQMKNTMRGNGLAGRAKSAVREIRDRAVKCLRLEVEQVRVELAASILAQRPFMARAEVARKFALALFQTGGLDVKFTFVDPSFGESSRLAAKLKELETALQIIEGQAERFAPIGHYATSADGVLSFAGQLPEEDLPQLIEAWTQATVEGAAKIALTYTSDLRLTWRISKPKAGEPRTATTHDLKNYDIAGQTNRALARSRA